MNSIMTDYGFYSEQQLTELDTSDLSFEIADTSRLLNTPEAHEYFKLLVTELKKRGE